MMRLRRKKEEEDREEHEKEYSEGYEGYDPANVFALLLRDENVSEVIKKYKSLIPVDSHKIDFGLVPPHRLDVLEMEIKWAAIAEIETNEKLSDEDVKLISNYTNILSVVRLYTSTNGWLLRTILGGGRK
ncbi:MAG: hypothetical protein QXM76_05120 [Zestosphaera sp.]